MSDNNEDEKPVGYASPPKNTQFGAENSNPRSQDGNANKPWSIRNSIRYLARQEIDQADGQAFKKILPKKPTVAQLIAANTLAKATKADMRAVEYVTDQIDGKLAQTNINGDLAAIMGMSDDELRKLVEAGRDFDTASEVSAGSDGAAQASGSQGSINPEK